MSTTLTLPAVNARDPFRGVNTQLDPRDVDIFHATDCDNVVCVDDDVTQRPGLEDAPGGGSIDIVDILAAKYVAGEMDYMLAVAEDAAYAQIWDQFFQPMDWKELRIPTLCRHMNGVLYEHDRTTYVGERDANYAFRDRMGLLELDEVGLSSFTDEDHDPTISVPATESGIYGTCRVWISRYNENTGVESNAVQCLTSGGTETVAPSDEDIQVDLSNISAGNLVGLATHYRIYLSRADGRDQAGLIAQIPVDERTDTSFTYIIGTSETNGGSPYATADDTADYNYVPCTMNGIPPAATAMCFYDGRMFYGTATGEIYFSQNIEELQGHVEHVPADSYRVLPSGEKVVGLIEYQEALYIFSQQQIHRSSGAVNSLTNEQVELGESAANITSYDVQSPVEGTVGCISGKTIIEVETLEGAMIFFCGLNNIYRFNGVTATPIADDIQDEYLRRLAAAGNDGVTVAHFAVKNLIVWCFKDNGLLTLDYRTGDWTFWDTYPVTSEVDATSIGPVCTRAIHNVEARDPVLLRQATAGGGTLEAFAFDVDSVQDDGVNFPSLWQGPEIDMSLPAMKKYHLALVANYRKQASGTVKTYAYIDGDSAKQIPATPIDWPQNIVDLAQPTIPLAFRAVSVMPRFELAEGVRSRLLGYAISEWPVGGT